VATRREAAYKSRPGSKVRSRLTRHVEEEEYLGRSVLRRFYRLATPAGINVPTPEPNGLR